MPGFTIWILLQIKGLGIRHVKSRICIIAPGRCTIKCTISIIADLAEGKSQLVIEVIGNLVALVIRTIRSVLALIHTERQSELVDVAAQRIVAILGAAAFDAKIPGKGHRSIAQAEYYVGQIIVTQATP